MLGLGDVYLGAPVATPIDPRHRLVTTKYNPARTWTPENAVGIGGAYLCVYGMEGPGGYQFVGRTLQMWNSWKHTAEFEPGTPWLLRFFDQIRFYPVSAEELLEIRDAFPQGGYPLRIEPVEFRLRDYHAFLSSIETESAAFKSQQQAAFEAERERWAAAGKEDFSAGIEPLAPASNGDGELPEGCHAIPSPVTASVWKVAVEPGERVEAGQELVILEAMKMEIAVAAPSAGTVEKLNCAREAWSRRASAWSRCDTRLPHRTSSYLGSLRRLRLRRATAIRGDRVDLRPSGNRSAEPGLDFAGSARRSADSCTQAGARTAGARTLPLYGVPFAIKDNIDVAGMPTTAACPAYSYTPARSATVVATPGGRRRHPDRQNQSRSVRHRSGGHALALRRMLQRLRSALHLGRIELRFGCRRGSRTGRIRARHRYRRIRPRTRRVQRSRRSQAHARPAQRVRSRSRLPQSGLRLDPDPRPAPSAHTVWSAARGFDPADPYSRGSAPAVTPRRGWPGHSASAYPPLNQLEFFGDEEAGALYAAAVRKLEELGGKKVEIDFSVFRAAADLLYSGPWVAERLAAIREFVNSARRMR